VTSANARHPTNHAKIGWDRRCGPPCEGDQEVAVELRGRKLMSDSIVHAIPRRGHDQEQAPDDDGGEQARVGDGRDWRLCATGGSRRFRGLCPLRSHTLSVKSPGEWLVRPAGAPSRWNRIPAETSATRGRVSTRWPTGMWTGSRLRSPSVCRDSTFSRPSAEGPSPCSRHEGRLHGE